MTKPLAPSRALAAKVIFAALQYLVERGGEAPSKDVIEAVGQRVPFTDWEKGIYEKTGNTRWKSILRFFSIDLIKAGFLVKNKGVWFATPEGEAALKLGEVGLLEASRQAYLEWRKKNPKAETPISNTDNDLGVEITEAEEQESTIDEVEADANDGLIARVNNLPPYDFQALVAALLRGMGYYTPFVAPKGKDGGIDVMAYQDPLGVAGVRIKVQVKHRESAATVQEVRELMGLLRKDGDVGMFVSSGGFTADAKVESRTASVHIELVDLHRFLDLWRQFYPKLEEEDKNRLRLKPIYFFDPS